MHAATVAANGDDVATVLDDPRIPRSSHSPQSEPTSALATHGVLDALAAKLPEYAPQ
jgi:hypothetical protein